MIRLALDSSVQPHSLAVQKNQQPIVVKILADEKSGAENLVCEIESLIKKNNIELNQFDQIITTQGPGPFIGLRIGLAAMHGISCALNIPLQSISTLAALASFIQAPQEKTITAYLPARRGFSVFQSFDHQQKPLSDLQTLDNQSFELLRQQQQNMLFASQKTPRPLAAQLLTLPQHLMHDGAQPIYPH